VERCPADHDVAVALGVDVETEVVAIERLRRADGEALAVMRNWLPPDLAPTEEALRAHGLYELMRGLGVHMRIANQRIGAIGAFPTDARLQCVKRGAPLLTMERITYDDGGRPVELGRHVYRAETYTFETTVAGR
jgi:DNA-binding GntR family transcriptional regulator